MVRMADRSIDKVMDRRAIMIGSPTTSMTRRGVYANERYGYKLMTDAEYEALPQLPPHEVCRAEVEKALLPWLDLCEQGWGFRPPLTFKSWSSARCRVVKVDFNIKGFTHDGRRIYCNRRSWTKWRTPAKIAKEIIGEISQHRNTCADCGEGIACLHDRLRGQEAWSFGHESKRVPGFISRYDTTVEKKQVLILLDLMTPPDAVELKLHPALSRKLLTMLRSPESQAILNHPDRLAYLEERQRNPACRIVNERQVRRKPIRMTA